MISFLKKLVVKVGLLSFLTLAVTGFLPYFFFGGTVSGYWLIVHVTAGGFFSACAAGWTVLYAESHRFTTLTAEHAETAEKNFKLNSANFAVSAVKIKEACFWVIVVLSLLVILSVLLSMFKFFGTDWQRLLLQTHLYGTIALSLFIIAYLNLSATHKKEQEPTL